MGCRFALDDFGRGLSSFGNLKNLSLDYLKIDGSFIRNLGEDTVNQAMVAAMIKLARTLKFQVVAEQVEDVGALEAATENGCRLRAGIPPWTTTAACTVGRMSELNAAELRG